MNILSRIPSWLYGALRLQEPELPTQLDTTAVNAQLDVFQQGWGLATYVRGNPAGVGASAAASRVTFIEPDDDWQYIVLGIEISHTGGAAAGLVRYEIFDTRTATGISFASFSIPVDGEGLMVDFLQSYHPIRIPAGYGFTGRFPATGLSEGYGIELIYARIPAGFAT